MELDKLQIDLRPRPNAHALDLGFALLRANAGAVYGAWLCLWLPLLAICYGLSLLFHGNAAYWIFLAWWLRPLLERAPLYVLSRQVFGEDVTWQQAVRAWPKQLGGGWFRLLTWWRFLVPSRGLYQAIWQLEGARGKAAAERRKVIGRRTNSSAYWFGIACAHFEVIIQVGFLSFISIFMSDEGAINPFAIFTHFGTDSTHAFENLMSVLSYAIPGAIVGPIYTACCFTLYLNRRATVEAWDIEIVLRQIKPPVKKTPLSAKIATVALTVLFLAGMSQTPSAEAAPIDTPKCPVPEWEADKIRQITPGKNEHQIQLKKELATLYATSDLARYECEENWRLKNPGKPEKIDKKKPTTSDGEMLGLIAFILKIILIASAVGLVIYVLYRYQDHIRQYFHQAPPKRATEVGGLDIRPESLPDDVVAAVLTLWTENKRRLALGLLYRASLSRLVSVDGLVLTYGATEGDCLRLAKQAQQRQQLSAERFAVIEACTHLWLQGAYADRWPATINDICTQWQRQFDAQLDVQLGMKAETP